MSSFIEPGLGLREPDPMPDEFIASRWALNAQEKRALMWKLLVGLPLLLLVLVALLAPGAFGAAIEACGGG